MSDIPPDPCPRCGEPAPPTARACPRCHGNLLVDVSSGAIADPKARYVAARDLARLGAPFPAFVRLQESLASPQAVLVTGATRAQGMKAVEILETSGGRGVLSFDIARSSEPEVPILSAARPAGHGGNIFFALGAAAGLLVVLAVILLARKRVPVPSETARSAPAATPSAASRLSAPAPAPTAAAPAGSLRDAASAALPSTVSILCAGSGGAGFFVTPELVVTNEHVLCAQESPIEVLLHDGRRLPGVAVRRDDWLDVALVRVSGAAARPIRLGDATRLSPGENVLAIGNPRALDFSVTRGIISHSERNVYGIAYLQFDGSVNPGNSGGPLIDSEGRAIGIVSMMVRDARGLGLALPINYVYESGSSREVPLPLPPPDFRRWSGVLERVRAADARELVEAQEAFKIPALGGAGVHPDGRVFAILVARGRPSGARVFRFLLSRGGQTLCTPSGLVETWDFYSRERGESSGDPRLFRWLERNGLSRDLYVGSAQLAWEGCPDPRESDGAELTLPEAPGGIRVALSPFHTE
ncbi:MAG TPA: trypsin-like peptidase domain-containing protein [Thermoanaerobaculia bacterium]